MQPLRSMMILFDPDQPEAAQGFPRLSVARANRALKSPLPGRPTLMRYLREVRAAVGLKGEVSVLLTTNEGIRGLNRRFRKKNKATDVLSFPAEAGFGIVGDLAISVETAARQAEEQGHRLSMELRVLMLHGMLHLAGYDHEADAGEMARKECRLRTKLGLPLGLIERASGRRSVVSKPVVSKPVVRKSVVRKSVIRKSVVSNLTAIGRARSRFSAGMTERKAGTKTETISEVKTRANIPKKASAEKKRAVATTIEVRPGKSQTAGMRRGAAR
jgi:probable rRNA maturation factor